MRNRTTRVCFPVFRNYVVRVILARDIERTGRRLHSDLSNAAAAFVTQDDKPGRGWLVLGPGADEALVAHEASHAIRAMFASRGVRNDDETFAYHLDFLVGRIHRFLKR